MPNLPARDLDHVLVHTEEIWSLVRGERIFMTGGTGFVGSWLTESLLWANHRLSLGISLVLLARNPEAFRRRSPHLAADPAVTLWMGDCQSFDFPPGSFPLVVHLATERCVPANIENAASAFGGDISATRRVLELAGTRSTRRLLFTSSGAIYGKQPADLSYVPEDYAGAPSPTDVSSVYGQSKRVSEFLCSVFSRVYGFEAIICRLFTFVGPMLPLDANYAVGNFMRDAMGGGPVRIRGDGTPYRSYLYAADLAIWLWVLLVRGEGGTAYNVGSPHEISIAELARRILKVAAPQGEICIARKAEPGGPQLRYVPSTERAGRLGLQPWIPLDEALRRTCEWHLQARVSENN